MRNRITYLVLLLSIFGAATANPVDETQAQEVGYKFLNATRKMDVKNTDALHLVKTYRCETGEAAFYVFNTESGFVIVSADDCVTPILGYSYEGTYDPDNVPIQMQDYLNGFLKQIECGMASRLKADYIIAARWERVRTTGRINEGQNNHEVLPLLKDKWNQNCYYNKFCPVDSLGPCGHAYAGCVATAMAQIMNYWKYPESGQGSHSYIPSSHPEYGEQFVDFSETTYDWGNMPISLNASSSEAEIDAVATLMRHCGVSVDMQYGPNSSGAYFQNVSPALLNYFGYSDDLHVLNREDDSIWLATVKACLDLLRPLYYLGAATTPSGEPSSNYHAFVCDGYDRDDFLHFNWGWGGSSNGYYAMDHMSYTIDNKALFDIHAPSDPNHTCQINVVANLSDAGVVEGGGVCCYGSLCTLTAHAFEGYRFLAWMENGMVLSIDTVYSFLTVEDSDIEACFERRWSTEVAVSCHHDSVLSVQSAVISWANDSLSGGDANAPWSLLHSFDNVPACSPMAFDGLNIYASSSPHAAEGLGFRKYDPSGRMIESFTVDGCGLIQDLAYDGQFYYGSRYDSVLYCIDLVNKTLVNKIPTSCHNLFCCTYDPDCDGFWVNDDLTLKLINRNGNIIKTGPTLYNYFTATYYKNAQGNPHLYIIILGKVFDYDINADVLGHDMLYKFPDFPFGSYHRGTYLEEYLGRTALFAIREDGQVTINQLPLDVSPVRYHRVYRIRGTTDDRNVLANRELLADRYCGSSYTDWAWDALSSGIYTYGVSLLRGEEESEISWSESVVRINDHSVNELGADAVSLHPNPAHDCLTVDYLQPIRRCEVFSLTGALMYSKTAVDGMKMEIDISNLPSGLYLIRLFTDGETLTEKFVKQ